MAKELSIDTFSQYLDRVGATAAAGGLVVYRGQPTDRPLLPRIGRLKTPETPAAPPPAPKATAPLSEARDIILRAMDAIGQEEEWFALGPLGQYITAANPDFDTRTYGRKKLSDLVQDLKVFETKRGQANQLLIRRID